MQECPLGLSFSKWQFSALRMARKVRAAKDVNRTFFCDASVCALSIGTHSSRCRIGTDWYALFLCSLSRLVCECGKQKDESKFGSHRICSKCRLGTESSPATISIQITPTSLSDFFNHESSQGSRLSLIQRSSILTLHSSLFGFGRRPYGSADRLQQAHHSALGHSLPRPS